MRSRRLPSVRTLPYDRAMSAHTPSDPAKIQRQKRLEETLKENLRRRKAQARARSDREPGEADDPAAGDDGDGRND
jgi:hypothetical protein